MLKYTLVAAVVYLVLWLGTADSQSAVKRYAPAATPLSIANAAWPGSPCAGRIRVYVDPTLTARRPGVVGEATGMRIQSEYVWRLYSCDVAVDAGYWRTVDDYERCRVLVHEAGHLAGQRHQPKGIMREDHTAHVRACARAFLG